MVIYLALWALFLTLLPIGLRMNRQNAKRAAK
jgi:hypothetical protein